MTLPLFTLKLDDIKGVLSRDTKTAIITIEPEFNPRTIITIDDHTGHYEHETITETITEYPYQKKLLNLADHRVHTTANSYRITITDENDTLNIITQIQLTENDTGKTLGLNRLLPMPMHPNTATSPYLRGPRGYPGPDFADAPQFTQIFENGLK